MAVDALKAAIAMGMTQRDALASLTEQHSSCLVRMSKGLQYIADLLADKATLPMAAPVWRRWQQRLLDRLAKPREDRKIIWVLDEKGNAGKSTLTRYLLSNTHAGYRSTYLSGKLTDMYHTYQKNKAGIVIFDVPRTHAEFRSHLATMAEQLKNGFYNSSKYDSCCVRFEPPHVVFFSNSPPEAGWWSEDRLELWDIKRDTLVMPGTKTSHEQQELFYDSEEDDRAGLAVTTFNAATVRLSAQAFDTLHGDAEGAARTAAGFKTPKNVGRALAARAASLQQRCAIAEMDDAQRNAFNSAGPAAAAERCCWGARACDKCREEPERPAKRARKAGIEGTDENGVTWVPDEEDVSDSDSEDGEESE